MSTEQGRGAREPTLDERRDRVSSRFRSVGASAEALRGEVRAVTDWRTQAARHPLWVLGAAVGAGLLVARLLRRGRPVRRDRTVRVVRAAAERLEQVAGGGRSLRSSRGLASRAAPVVRSALGIVAGESIRRLGRRLKSDPGFRSAVSGRGEPSDAEPFPRDRELPAAARPRP